MDATDGEDLQKQLADDDFSFVFDCGYSGQISINNRRDVLEAIWKHLTHFSILAELTQLREGIRGALSFHHFIDTYPAAVLKMLSMAQMVPISMDQFLECFVPKFSDTGCNQRITEEALMHNFTTFLEECEDGLTHCSCSDILAFTTGASAIPPLGFSPQPSIKFTPAAGLPTASTCTNTLRIPLHLTEYARFKEAFDLAIRGCQGFGTL